MNKWLKKLQDNIAAEFKSNKKLSICSNSEHSSDKSACAAFKERTIKFYIEI